MQVPRAARTARNFPPISTPHHPPTTPLNTFSAHFRVLIRAGRWMSSRRDLFCTGECLESSCASFHSMDLLAYRVDMRSLVFREHHPGEQMRQGIARQQLAFSTQKKKTRRTVEATVYTCQLSFASPLRKSFCLARK